MPNLFDASAFIDEAIETLKTQIDDKAIIACSGGVDSTVAAVLAQRAVGDKLHCVYVDTGFMRKGETVEIQEMFAKHGIDLVTVEAANRYFEVLEGITEPEQRERQSVKRS